MTVKQLTILQHMHDDNICAPVAMHGQLPRMMGLKQINRLGVNTKWIWSGLTTK